MSNLDLEKIIFPNDNNTYIIRDAQAHTDLANKADKDGSNIVGPWTMNITGHASQDIASTEKRQPGGVAELDQNGLIITSQLPSSVDEIIEGYYFNNKFYKDEQYTQEITGEASKIYIDLSSNQTYRWSGSTYVEISPSIALGVEHSTAGYGDWTNTAYLHATDANKISAAVASGLYKIAATSEGHISSLTAITKADITALGIPAQDTTYSQGTGISIDNNNVINHSNSVTAGTAKGDNSKTLTFGGTFTIPSVTYDAQGHITTKGTTTMTMPGNPNTTYTLGTSGNTVTLTPSSGSVQSITVPFATNATKATQDASGNTITTTYRRLDNNTFDTISVTDLTAGDVVVTGVGRFTNGLYGNLTGNADTATNVAWSGVTGKPSTYPPSPHSHAEIYTVGDYRSSATTPNDYKNMLRFQGLKSKATIDSPSSDTYSYLLGLRGWADTSGGDAWELAFNNSGINVRHGATTTWGAWTKLLDSSNYSSYAVPLQTAGGVATCAGGGNYWYFKLATIVITGTYVNRPILFELSSRGKDFKWLEVIFNSTNNTDPSLYSFITNGDLEFWIKKTATSTWEIYGKYDQTWGSYVCHRVTGNGADIGVTVNMTNYSNELPSDVTQVAYGWNCKYAVSAGTATDSTKVAKAGDTMSGGLTVEASNSYSSYNEGIRINAGARTYATLLMGGTAKTTSGTNDGAFWLGVYNTGTTARRLMIAHNGSTTTGTYFYADSSSQVSPALHLGAKLHLDYATTATMDATSTNPQIVFSETGGTQAVKIIYSDWDSYRAPYGLKVVGDGSTSPGAWLEVEGQIISDNNITASGNVVGTYIGVSANGGTNGGISLYSGAGNTSNYGIAMRKTSNSGVHGYVQGDWGIYFYMNSNSANRGWVFRNANNSSTVASINADNGNMVLNGSLTIGGNAANTSGVRQVYNSTTKSLDFVFVS